MRLSSIKKIIRKLSSINCEWAWWKKSFRIFDIQRHRMQWMSMMKKIQSEYNTGIACQIKFLYHWNGRKKRSKKYIFMIAFTFRINLIAALCWFVSWTQCGSSSSSIDVDVDMHSCSTSVMWKKREKRGEKNDKSIKRCSQNTF